jgi:F0F1-type ATP synthase membrane subunit b/b'
MFLIPDGTFLVQLVNFAVFFGLLSVVFLRPVGQAIRKRREYINSLTADYDRYQSEARVLRAQAEAVRAAARRDAEATLAKARAAASNEAATISADYAARSQAAVEHALETVGAEFDAARGGQDALVGELAHLMLERAMLGGRS